MFETVIDWGSRVMADRNLENLTPPPRRPARREVLAAISLAMTLVMMMVHLTADRSYGWARLMGVALALARLAVPRVEHRMVRGPVVAVRPGSAVHATPCSLRALLQTLLVQADQPRKTVVPPRRLFRSEAGRKLHQISPLPIAGDVLSSAVAKVFQQCSCVYDAVYHRLPSVDLGGRSSGAMGGPTHALARRAALKGGGSRVAAAVFVSCLGCVVGGTGSVCRWLRPRWICPCLRAGSNWSRPEYPLAFREGI